MVRVVNTNQNIRVLVRLRGSYPGCKEDEGSGSQGRYYTRVVGEITPGAYIYL